MRVRRGMVSGLVFGALVPALLAGCTVGPSDRPAVLEHYEHEPRDAPPGERRDLPPLGDAEDGPIRWAPCDSATTRRLDLPDSLRVSCARISSTVDAPALPNRGELRLSVLKVEKRGGDAAPRVPLVVLNDVDGEPGTRFAARLAATLPEGMLDTFAIIGMDRRGTGDSLPIDCVDPAVRRQLFSHDTERDIEPLLDAARKAGQECSIYFRNDQGAFDSWRAAGDLEQLRAALGVPRLHAIARGQAALVLRAYIERFTEQAGRIVLDGAPDPSGDARAVLADVAGGAEAALDAFADECSASDCPLGDDARDAVLALVEQLRERPRRTDAGHRVGPSAALYATWTGLADPRRWDALVGALDEAAEGDVDSLSEFLDPMLDYRDGIPPAIDAALTTRCNDTTTRLPADQIETARTELLREHPVFGGLVAQQLAWCSPWPVRREPLPEPGVDGSPPTLLVSTFADPRTPEIGTKRSAQLMPGAVRIGWRGAGHGAVGRSDCVNERVSAFLTEGTVPRNGMLCPP